jgi:hypothetical protein
MEGTLGRIVDLSQLVEMLHCFIYIWIKSIRQPNLVAALQEPGNEIGRQSLLSPEVLLFEVGHEMVRLAPEVHGLLVIGIALEKENIDGGQLVDVSVALKLLPDAGPDG